MTYRKVSQTTCDILNALTECGTCEMDKLEMLDAANMELRKQELPEIECGACGPFDSFKVKSNALDQAERKTTQDENKTGDGK